MLLRKMKRNLFKEIVEDIQTDEYFCNYRFQKSENTLYLRTGNEFVALELQHWRDQQDNSCVINPIYGKHFDVLVKWFEKFSFKPLDIQRINPNVMYDNTDFNDDRLITFKYDFSDYDEKIKMFLPMIRNNISLFASRYSTLEDYYNEDIVPILLGKRNFPDVGADWVFIYLTLVYLVDKKVYPYFKKRIMAHADWMQSRNEPNIEYYYDRMDEIITYMENNVVRL